MITLTILTDMQEISAAVMLCTAILATSLVLFFFALVWFLVTMRQHYRNRFLNDHHPGPDRWPPR